MTTVTKLACIILLLDLCGCHSPSNHNQIDCRSTYKRLNEDMFFISCTATSRTPPQVFRDALKETASEITVKNNYQYYVILKGPYPHTPSSYAHIYPPPSSSHPYDDRSREGRTKLSISYTPTQWAMTIQCYKDKPNKNDNQRYNAREYFLAPEE